MDALGQIMRRGARIGFSGPEAARAAKNLTSALDNPEFMDESVASLLRNHQVHGPFSAPPLPAFRTSPLGSVTRKRNPDKRRLINHLSWPKGASVNDGIPDSEAYIAYEMFERAVNDLKLSGPGSLMAKLDLKDAFRHIPISPEDWHHMGFSWRRQLYYCVVLTFGLRSAPYIFNLFAEALHWIIQRHVPSRLRHYLDDFLLIFPPDHDPVDARRAVEWVMGLGRALGLCFQDAKTVWPSTCIDFLGLELDSVAMEARLPPDKLQYLRELLQIWARKHSATLRETQELVGFLQFCSQVIPRSRTYIRRLIDFSMNFTSSFQVLRIPAGAHADIRWWSIFCSVWNGVRILSTASAPLQVYTDASGTKGLGGLFGKSWFSSRIPRRFRGDDIQFKETYAVLQAILRWGDLWDGAHVNFNVDNQAVVVWLNSGSGKSPRSMNILRMISMLSAFLNFSFSSSWISTVDNAIADAASRFQYSRLFQLAAHLPRTSSSTKSRITGIKRTLASLDARRSICGTALPPAPGARTPLVSDPTSISSCLIPRSSPRLASISPLASNPLRSGSPTSPTGVLSPTQLSLTLPASAPSTPTPGSPPTPQYPPQFSAYSEESSALWASHVSPSFQSHSPSCGSSRQSLARSPTSRMPLLTRL